MLKVILCKYLVGYLPPEIFRSVFGRRFLLPLKGHANKEKGFYKEESCQKTGGKEDRQEAGKKEEQVVTKKTPSMAEFFIYYG